MYKKDVIAYFGHRQAPIARALGISKAAVGQWREIIPEGKAYRLQTLTNGALRVDPSLYEKPPHKASEAA